MLALVSLGVAISAVSAMPARTGETAVCPPARTGEVSIGAAGDILIYDVAHGVPADRGRSYFNDVRPWFTQDIVTGNLEQAITEDTGYNKCGSSTNCVAFRSDPDAAGLLAGFDILN